MLSPFDTQRLNRYSTVAGGNPNNDRVLARPRRSISKRLINGDENLLENDASCPLQRRPISQDRPTLGEGLDSLAH